jgi:hypothetical protein
VREVALCLLGWRWPILPQGISENVEHNPNAPAGVQRPMGGQVEWDRDGAESGENAFNSRGERRHLTPEGGLSHAQRLRSR